MTHNGNPRLLSVQLPFPNSYVVLPGKLAAGEYPGDKDADQTQVKLANLLDARIDAVVDLTEEGEHTYTLPLRPYHADLQRAAAVRGKECIVTRVAIRDGSVPDDATLTHALDRIDVFLSEGRSVYVHCWGGHGRTGLVVGCWLMRHRLADAESVLRILKEFRKEMPKAGRLSPETNEQREKVVRWKERE